MPAKSLRVNLAPKDEFEQSLIGQVLKWALTAGKSIVILTEFVVILAFLSRFKLDMDLNDLNEVIIQKQAIIDSYAEVEQQMRDIQTKIGVLQTATTNTIGVAQATENLTSKLSGEVVLETLTMTKDSYQLKGGSSTEVGLASLIEAFRTDESVTTLSVGEISFNQRKGLIEFSLLADKTIPKKTVPKTTIKGTTE